MRLSCILIAALFAAMGIARTIYAQDGVDERLLPTGRAISPAGEVILFAGRPVDLVASFDQRIIFVKDKNHLRAIDSASFKLLDSISIDGGASLFGIDADKNGTVFVSNAKSQVFAFRLNEERKLESSFTIELPADSFPCGLSVSENQKQLFVCLSKQNSIAIVDLPNNAEAGPAIANTIDVGIAPFDIKQIGDELVVSNIGGRRPKEQDKTAPSAGSKTLIDDRGIANSGTLSVVSLDDLKTTSEIQVGLLPSVMTRLGQKVVVCNTNEDSLSLVDLGARSAQTINAKPNESLGFGSMPNAACWIPDHKLLVVALAGNNALSVFRVNDDKFELTGLIPTAWFPGGLAFTDTHLFVSNIKGTGSRSIKRDKAKGRNSHDHQGVVQKISIRDILDPQQLEAWTNQVNVNSKLAQIVRNQELNSDEIEVVATPVPEKLGQPSVFKHVIYVVKENRTFDQVFGDMTGARSDASLCLFPREITPNHHALADRFGVLDNYYCNGVLSADGHSWATEGNVTPYLERAFGGFARSYTFGNDPITYSSSGFLWDHVLAAGLSFRNYGEMDYAKPPSDIKYQEIWDKYEAGENIEFTQSIGIERLKKYSCRNYPGWNMDIPDVLRMDRFLKEFREFENDGTLPNVCLIYLPQDHLGAAGVTSNAHMADNDLALGRLVEAVSHSRFWKDTVIFVNEDDPQNGFDHVDGHRSLCLVISPYSKKGVNHNFYNQTSVLRTMLHMFGIPPMNQQDASAPLMRECFQQTADTAFYDALTPNTALNEGPKKRAEWSPRELHWRQVLATVPIERTGMKTEDDENNLNRFIWHDVKGWDTPYPTEFAGAHGRGLEKLGLKFDPNSDED